MASAIARIAEPAHPRLVRSLRQWELAAVAVNGVIGAGIFGLPSRVYALAGTWSLPAFFVCALLAGLIVLCFAEVSSRFTDTGGPYLYAREAFGPVAGFSVGWLLWLARITAFAANSSLLLDYAGYFYPQLAAGWERKLAAAFVVSVFLVLNLAGIRQTARASNCLSAIKLGALAIFAIAGLFFVHWDRLALTVPFVPRTFSGAVLLLVYAFTGFEMAAVPAGEARDPRSTLPAALIGSVGVTALLYFAIQMVCIGTVPGLGQSQRPLADAASCMLGGAGAVALAVVAVLAIAGNLNVLMLSASRLPFAMAERGELPAALASTHRRFRTPHIALLATATVIYLLTVSGTFSYAVTISAISRLVAYLATCLALPTLRRSAAYPPLLRLPLGSSIAAAASLAIVWLLSQCAWREARDTAIAAGVGMLIYALGRSGRGLL
jgi:amino acid transporter